MTLVHIVQSTYNSTKALISNFVSGTEKMALVKGVEELKTQLQRATEHTSKLCAKLEVERNENNSVWEQILYLNNELHQEKSCTKINRDRLQKERLECDMQHKVIVELSQQLEEMQSKLDEQMKKQWDSERRINNLTSSYTKSFNELNTAYNAICESHKIQQQQLAAQKNPDELLAVKRELEELTASHNDLQQRYDTDIKAQKWMNATLQEKVNTHLKSHARTVSEHKKQVQDMILEQNAYRQKVEYDKLSLIIDLKSDNIDLKIQLYDQILKNAELDAKLKAEEEANQVLRTENIRLMQELKDPELVEEESLRVLQEPELVEEESLRVLQEPELVEEESLRVLQEPELVEEESLCVLQDQNLWQSTSSVLHMIKNLWMGPSALPMIPNTRRGYFTLYRSQNV